MRKIVIFTLLLLVISFSGYAAENWKNYESGRNNIRLEGYKGQPGYIAFEDGNGTTLGYLFMSDAHLVFVSASAWDTSTTKLGSSSLYGQWLNGSATEDGASYSYEP